MAQWESASRLVRAALPLFQVLAHELIDLLNQSDARLKPLADPLRADFGAHRWLKAEREEAYSDWLAWILKNLRSPMAIVDLFKIQQLFPDRPLGDPATLPRHVVAREVTVPRGHAGKQGRLDLVIRFKPLAVIVVEAKMGDAEGADTAKQDGYAEWLAIQGGTPFPILLATNGANKLEYEGGFRLLKWADLSLALRGVAVNLIAQGETILGAMTLAFIGAVERNLIGLSVSAVGNPAQRPYFTFDPSVVFHLKRWLGKTGGK
jgi:hypothetical protein